MSEVDPTAYIRESIRKVTLENRGMIDANQIAASVHAVYPSHDMTLLSELVIAEAVRMNGNVRWGAR